MSRTMKAVSWDQRTVVRVVATAGAAIAFGAIGIADLVKAPAIMAGLAELGYPSYLATILGFWKVAGAVTIATPLPRGLKEWAYAGMFFDLSGAAASHAALSHAAGTILGPLALLALVGVSWALQPPFVPAHQRSMVRLAA